MRQKNIYFDKMMRLRQKQSKTMRLSDLEQTDVLQKNELRENRDSMKKPILKIQKSKTYILRSTRVGLDGANSIRSATFPANFSVGR